MQDLAPGGVLAPGPAPVRNGNLAWRDTLGPNQLEMVTFQLEIIGPEAQARPWLTPLNLQVNQDSCRGGHGLARVPGLQPAGGRVTFLLGSHWVSGPFALSPPECISS